MTRHTTSRRRALRALAAGGAALLAGCSDGMAGTSGSGGGTPTETTATDLSGGGAGLAHHLPDFEGGDVDGSGVSLSASVPTRLAGYRRFRRSMDWFSGLSAVDGRAADWVVTGLGRSFVAAAVPFDQQELTSELSSRGVERDGSVGDYDVYASENALVGLRDSRLLVSSPSEVVSLSRRALLERLVSLEASDVDAFPARPAARELLSAVRAEDRVYVELQFEGNTFGEETTRVPGARGFVMGGTVVDDGQSYRQTVGILFPEGAVDRDAFEEWLPRYLPSNGGPAPTVERDGRVLSAHRPYSLVRRTTRKTTQKTTPAIRPGDTVVRVVGEKFEWSFDYPREDVAGRSELVVPVGSRVVFAGTSRDVVHGFAISGLDVSMPVLPKQRTYATVTPDETGTYTAFCTEYCGSGHSQMTAPARVVEESAYRNWLDG